MPAGRFSRLRERLSRPAELLCLAVLVASAGNAGAQDLEPRAYSAAPIGVNFFVVAAVRSTGGVVVDPSLPLEDVEATVDSMAAGVGRTINMFGRTGLVLFAVPYAWVVASGSVGEEARRITRSGVADPRVKVSVNLVGGRAQTPAEFARSRRSTIVGVSLSVLPPLGQYRRTKLINLGANRWSFKPEVGVSRALGRWTVEGYGGTWLFTDNEAFYTGTSVRTQERVVTVQGHVSYTFRPGLWAAFDAAYHSGGTTRVDGVKKADLQRNSRIGATLSLPVARQQSLKFSTSAGTTTRFGADFRTFAAGWQLSWLD